MFGFVILAAMEHANQQQSEKFAWDKDRLQAQWHAFDFADTEPLSRIEAAYCRYYQLDFSVRMPGARHRFGYVEVDGYQLATHYYSPPGKPHRATVLILHGYFSLC